MIHLKAGVDTANKHGGLMARDTENLKHLLEIEYEHSQRAIDKFDEYRARLKSWMITGVAGLAAIAVSSRNASIFLVGALLVFLFGLSELAYIDIQEDAIARNREVEKLLDSLSRDNIGPEHEAYTFGLGKVFGGGRIPKLRDAVQWILYRTFNPMLYASLLCLMLAATFIEFDSTK